ncbi:MAG: hypothetical protein ACI4MH_01250 [Candidatus Coproplasma sp.]
MKAGIKNVLSAVTAAILLGTALSCGAYSFLKTSGETGFKGIYSLNAFAEEETDTSTDSIVTVLGQVIDVTGVLSIASVDGEYTLYISAIDTSDMEYLSNIQVGYTIGKNTYNGTDEGLSNKLYSSLTVKTGESSSETIHASSCVMSNATNTSTAATPYFVIAEVRTASVGGDATFTINANISTTFDLAKEEPTNSFFTVTGGYSDEMGSVTYKGITYSECLIMEGRTSITFSLLADATVTFVFGDTTSVGGKAVKIDELNYYTDSDGIVSVDLIKGYHSISKGDTINLFYIEIM